MFAFIVRRIIQALLVMLIIGMVGFFIQNQIGDPVRDLVGERVTPAEREVIRDQLGLNDPVHIQYIRFVKNALKGDLGLSFFYKKPALEVIIRKAPATIELVLVTALILIVVSIPAGVYSLNLVPDTLMKRALAVFIVLVVLFERWRQGQGGIGKFAKTGPGGMILGMISGWFIGAYTTGGPPAVIYATARFPEPRNAKGAMGLYFLATDVLIVLLFAMTGLLTVDLLFQALRFTPAVLAGFLAGSYFFQNITKHTYMLGVHLLLVMAAIMLTVP